MANIYDVAKRAKVSTATVSKVLSNTPYVSATTRERVLEAVKALDYEPSLAARALTHNRTYIVGLVIPYDPNYLFSDPFLLEVIRGVDEAVTNHDYNLLLSTATRASNQTNQRSAYNRLMRSGYVDGAITIETFEGDEPAHQLEAAGIQRVSVGYLGTSVASNAIHSDDYGGALAIVRYLLDLGHRRIGVISGPPNFMGAMDERLHGYQQALQEYNAIYDSRLIAFGDFTVESGYLAATHLLALEPRPTALFGMNDRMAIGAIRRARELGLKVPGDLSVTGFDDVALSIAVDPPLTTVRQNAFGIGHTAASKLFDLLDNQMEAFDSVVLPTELIVRGSTAPLVNQLNATYYS